MVKKKMIWSIVIIVFLSLIAIIFILFLIGAKSWNAQTKLMHQNLQAGQQANKIKTYQPAEIKQLPLPVQKYFKKVLPANQPIISSVKIKHRGTFNMSDSFEDWKRFSSCQYVVTKRPGFDWEARIYFLPLLAAKVHDAYIAGEGSLQVAFLGFERLVNLKGTPEIAQGELMRFLAEATWYPTALLPSQGVRWQAVDQNSAKATLKDGQTEITLLFKFSDDGLIESISAKNRMRNVKGQMVPTLWECRLSDYQLHEGILIPFQGEVLWHLDNGPLPYWRGQIKKINYSY